MICLDWRRWDLCNGKPEGRDGEFPWQPRKIQQCRHACKARGRGNSACCLLLRAFIPFVSTDCSYQQLYHHCLAAVDKTPVNLDLFDFFRFYFWNFTCHYLLPARWARYWDECVCLSVCLSVHLCISAPHVQMSPNFLYMLPMAVAWSFSDGSAVRYIFPVLWMMSFTFNGANGPESEMMLAFHQVRQVAHRCFPFAIHRSPKGSTDVIDSLLAWRS